MAGGLVGAIARTWADPRGAMAEEAAEGLSEARALLHLLLACGFFFVASVPAAVRTAGGLGVADPVTAALAAHLFAFGVLAPLLLYGLAALLHLAARAFGGRGGFLGARAALFRTALAGTPIALVLALAGVAAELAGGGRLLPWLAWLGYAGLAFWLWLLAAGLAEAEGFATLPVAAVLAAAFAAVAGLLDVLAGGAAAG
jgi:hypothetical protein